MYEYGSVLRREILLQHDILIIFGQAIQGKLLDSGCRRDEDAGQRRYAVAHAYIHTTRLLWRKFPGSARQGKSKMKREEKSVVICFSNMQDQIRKEYSAEARQANPREIVNSVLHESLYLPEGEIKRYIRIRDCNVQVHINGEGKQEHVYAYTRPAASCSYTYSARCVCTGLLPIEPKTRRSRKLQQQGFYKKESQSPCILVFSFV